MFKEEKPILVGKLTKGTRKRIYAKKVIATEDVTMTDVSDYIDEEMKSIAEKHPNAQMNIAIKYSPISDPKSGGWFSVTGEKRLTVPYDMMDFYIEYLYIQYTLN